MKGRSIIKSGTYFRSTYSTQSQYDDGIASVRTVILNIPHFSFTSRAIDPNNEFSKIGELAMVISRVPFGL